MASPFGPTAPGPLMAARSRLGGDEVFDVGRGIAGAEKGHADEEIPPNRGRDWLKSRAAR